MPSTALLQRLAITGALVSIDAIADNANIAQTILDAGGDYLLAVKGNQETLEQEIRSYFETAPKAELQTLTLLDKDHGRLETRTHRPAKKRDWLIPNLVDTDPFHDGGSALRPRCAASPMPRIAPRRAPNREVQSATMNWTSQGSGPAMAPQTWLS